MGCRKRENVISSSILVKNRSFLGDFFNEFSGTVSWYGGLESFGTKYICSQKRTKRTLGHIEAICEAKIFAEVGTIPTIRDSVMS